MQGAEKGEFINHPILETFEENSLNLIEKIVIRVAEIELEEFGPENISFSLTEAQNLAKEMRNYYNLLKGDLNNIDNETIAEIILFFDKDIVQELISHPYIVEEFANEIDNKDFFLFDEKLSEYLLELNKKFEKSQITTMIQYNVIERKQKINKVIESIDQLSQKVEEIQKETQELLLEIAKINITNYLEENNLDHLDRVQEKIKLESTNAIENSNPNSSIDKTGNHQKSLIEDYLFLLQKKDQFSCDIQNHQEILENTSEYIPLKKLKKPQKGATTDEKKEHKAAILDQINNDPNFRISTIATSENFGIVQSTETRLHYLLNIEQDETLTLGERIDQHYDLGEFQFYVFFKEVDWTETALLKRLIAFNKDRPTQDQNGKHWIFISDFLEFIEEDFAQELKVLTENGIKSYITVEGSLEEIARYLKSYLNNAAIKREKKIGFLQQEDQFFELGEWLDVKNPETTKIPYKGKPAIHFEVLTKKGKREKVVSNGVNTESFELD